MSVYFPNFSKNSITKFTWETKHFDTSVKYGLLKLLMVIFRKNGFKLFWKIWCSDLPGVYMILQIFMEIVLPNLLRKLK